MGGWPKGGAAYVKMTPVRWPLTYLCMPVPVRSSSGQSQRRRAAGSWSMCCRCGFCAMLTC